MNIHDKWIWKKKELGRAVCLYDEFDWLGCDNILDMWFESWLIYESDVLSIIDNLKNRDFPKEKQDYYSFINRVIGLCSELQIKFITIEEEAKLRYSEFKNKSKIEKFTLYWNSINRISVWTNTHYSNLKLLLKEAYKYPRFFRDWKKLIILAKTWNRKAENILIKQNLLATVSIAKFYWRICWNVNFSELIQSWSIWIKESLERYDPKIGWNFYWYASWAIRLNIRKTLWKYKYLVDTPIHVYNDLLEFQSVIDKLTSKDWKEPTNLELANYLNKKVETVKRYKNLMKWVESLDELYEQYWDFIEDGNTLRPDQLAERDVLRANLDHILQMSFDEREALVLNMRYWLGWPAYTLEQVGQEIEVTRERVRQIEIKAIEKLRSERFYKILWIEDEIEKLNDPDIIKKRARNWDKFRNTVRTYKIDDEDSSIENENADDENETEETITPEASEIDFKEDEIIKETEWNNKSEWDEDEFNLNDEDEIDGIDNVDNTEYEYTTDIDWLFEPVNTSETSLFDDNRLLKLPLMSGIPHTTVNNLESYLINIENLWKPFSLEDFLNTYFDSLTPVWKWTFNARINVNSVDEQKEVSDIVKEYKTSEANIMLQESSIIKHLDTIFTTLWKTKYGEDYIQQYINSHYFDKDFWSVDYSFWDNDKFWWLLIWYIHSKLLSSVYQIFCINWPSFEFANIFFFYKWDVIKDDVLKNYLINIDKIYESDREEDVIYERDALIAKVITGNEMEYYMNEWYSYFIEQYLSKKYSIYLLDNQYLFRKNKDTNKYKILKEFMTFREPVHFTTILRNLKEKYPNVEWKESQVVTIIARAWITLWNWMYANSSCNFIEWTIGDVIESYLSQHWKSATEEEIIKYVKSQRAVTDSTIVNSFSKDNRFVKVYWWKIWLSSWWAAEDINNMEIGGQIINILSSNSGKDFSKYELYQNMPPSISINDFLKCLDRLIKDGKIWVIKKDITDFYYAL